MKEIKTKRLFLRKPDNSNKQDLINQIGNINVSQSLSHVPFPYTMDHADEWLKTVTQRAHKYNYSIFLDIFTKLKKFYHLIWMINIRN